MRNRSNESYYKCSSLPSYFTDEMKLGFLAWNLSTPWSVTYPIWFRFPLVKTLYKWNTGRFISEYLPSITIVIISKIELWFQPLNGALFISYKHKWLRRPIILAWSLQYRVLYVEQNAEYVTWDFLEKLSQWIRFIKHYLRHVLNLYPGTVDLHSP